jgi:hypothetical protein
MAQTQKCARRNVSKEGLAGVQHWTPDRIALSNPKLDLSFLAEYHMEMNSGN